MRVGAGEAPGGRSLVVLWESVVVELRCVDGPSREVGVTGENIYQ